MHHLSRLARRLTRTTATIGWIAVLAGLARTIAIPPVHEAPIPVTAINGQDLQYGPDNNLNHILDKLPGLSVDQSVNPMHDLSGITFDDGRHPWELDLSKLNTSSYPVTGPKLYDSEHKPLPMAWDDIRPTHSFNPPPGLSVPGPSLGYIFAPSTGHGSTFMTLPIVPTHDEVAGNTIYDKLKDILGDTDLDDLEYNIAGQSYPLIVGGSIRFNTPSTMGNFVPFTITDGFGHTDAYGLLPSIPCGQLVKGKNVGPPVVRDLFYVPVSDQAGKPVLVYGKFYTDQPKITFNGETVHIDAWTSYGIQFTLPLDIAGTTNLHIDDGPFHYKNPFSTIGLKLISDDRILKPGERDAFRVRVTGLDDIKSPVEVNVVDLEQNIVAMDGGAVQQYTIAPGSGGTNSRDYGLTAIQKGAADIVAWVPLVWIDKPIEGGPKTADSTSTTTETTGTTTVDTTGTTTSTGETTGQTTGYTTGTTTDTTGTTTGGTTTGSTTGSTTGQTTGNTTGDTTGTTHREDGGQRGLVYDGWFEPVQSVWQDDEKFDDKPTKQLTKLGPASWNAELKMIVGRPTRLYGLRPDRHKLIEITGETNRSIEVPVRFRFTLTENGLPPRVLYIEPEPHNTVFIDGPKGGIHKFDATLPAYDGIGQTDDTAFTFTNPGGYSIVADLIKPDGTSTGLSVNLVGDAVKTLPPKVYFLPMILNDPKPNKDSKATDREGLYNETASSIGFSAKFRAEECAKQIPFWYPLKPGDFHTEALDVKDYRGHIKKIDSDYTGDDDKANRNRSDKIAADIGRILSTQAYQEKATRIICMLTDDDFGTLRTGAAAFTETQKVIFVPQYEGVDTIAHEYVHTTPYLWSATQMTAAFGFSYHNADDQKYGDGAEIHFGTEEHRKSHMSALMGMESHIEKEWITQGTYWHLIGEFLAPHDPPVVCVTAVIKNDDGKIGAKLAPLYEQMGEVDLAEGPGDWQIVLKDGAGHVQGGYPFDPHWALDDCDRPNAYRAIAYRVPYKTDTAEIDIVGPGGKILDSRKISKHAPAVSITSPADGGQGTVKSGKVTVKWVGKDPDGGDLLYTVLYSPNNGDDWYVEDFETTDTTFDVPLEHGAAQPRVKVIATNGSRSSEAEVGFKIPIIAVH